MLGVTSGDSDLSPPESGPINFFSIFDCATSLVAIAVNGFVLSAVLQCPFSLNGYRRFLISLTAGDLYICSVNLLTFFFQMSGSFVDGSACTFFRHRCAAKFSRTMQLVGFLINLLNLCGMSVDHLVGILYPMRYRYLMSKNVARLSVAAIWIVSFSIGLAEILTIAVGIFNAQRELLAIKLTTPPPQILFKSNKADVMRRLVAMFDLEAEQRRLNESAMAVCNSQADPATIWLEISIISLACLCAVFLTVCYSCVLRRVSANADATGRGTTRKLILTTLMLLLSFLICWMPFTIFEAVMLVKLKFQPELPFPQLSNLLFTQQLLNSVLRFYPLIDPLIFAARIPSVQQFILFYFITRFSCCSCCIRFLSYRNRVSLYLTPSSARPSIYVNNLNQASPLFQLARRTSNLSVLLAAGQGHSESTMNYSTHSDEARSIRNNFLGVSNASPSMSVASDLSSNANSFFHQKAMRLKSGSIAASNHFHYDSHTNLMTLRQMPSNETTTPASSLIGTNGTDDSAVHADATEKLIDKH